MGMLSWFPGQNAKTLLIRTKDRMNNHAGLDYNEQLSNPAGLDYKGKLRRRQREVEEDLVEADPVEEDPVEAEGFKSKKSSESSKSSSSESRKSKSSKSSSSSSSSSSSDRLNPWGSSFENFQANTKVKDGQNCIHINCVFNAEFKFETAAKKAQIMQCCAGKRKR